MNFQMERENRGNGKTCTYHRLKTKPKWKSGCGEELSYIGYRYKYCPFCGKELRKAI